MKSLFYFVLLLTLVFTVGLATAGTEQNVSGWAWADTIGWVSFNCTNVTSECDRSNYGVNVADDGTLSGFAWSPNIGWISFNDLSADTGKPVSYSVPRVQETNVTGFAKILSLDNGGWLSFKDATYNTTTRQFSGWMWNGNTDGSGIGWVELRNVMRSAPLNTKPNTPTAVKPKDNIDIGTLDPSMTVSGVTFTWSNFLDPNPSDTQQAYEITIIPVGGGTAFTRMVENAGSSFAYGLSYPTLSYNTEYRWRVRVQDNHGEWSEWPAFASFRTPKHALPIAQFSTPEILPKTGDATQFTDTSEFDGSTQGTAWVWDFGDGKQSTDRNPTHTYLTPKEYSVCLRATDSDGYSNTYCTTVNATAKSVLPIWRRIIPF